MIGLKLPCFFVAIICARLTRVQGFDPQFGGECNITTVRVGCYRDRVLPARPIPQLLFTDRDPTSAHYSGGYVDLKNWNLYMKDLKCRCAEEAKSRGYSLFALQWYGECWSGNNSTHALYARDGPSQECVTHDLAQCTKFDKDCVGRDYTNFVYIIPGRKQDVPPKSTPAPTTSPPTPKTTHSPPTTQPPFPVTPVLITGTVTQIQCRPECFPPAVCPTMYPCQPLFVINKRRLDNSLTHRRIEDRRIQEPARHSSRLWNRILTRFSRRRGNSANNAVRYLLGSLGQRMSSVSGRGGQSK